MFFPINVKNGICLENGIYHLCFEDNTLDFVLIFTYKTRYYTPQNLSNNFDENFIENLNYLYHGIIHSGMLQTFWTSFNIIAYCSICKMSKYFIKNLTKPS